MRVIILGSGTCVPSLERSSPAVYLKIGNKNILVDCGSGTLHQLLKAGIDYKDIDMVFLTHFDPDHYMDLRPLIQALNWTPDFVRRKELVIVGPVGLKTFYDRKIDAEPRNNAYKITIKEISSSLDFKDFQVEYTKTLHNVESIAYKFIEDSKQVIITGDSDYDTKLAQFANAVDLLIIECAFPNNRKEEGHLIPSECGKIAQGLTKPRLYLTIQS